MSVPRKWSERSTNKSVDFPDGNHSSASSAGGIVVVHDASSASAAQLPPWIVPPDDASAAENRHVESTLQKLRDMPSVAPILRLQRLALQQLHPQIRPTMSPLYNSLLTSTQLNTSLYHFLLYI